jgi:hypothetical protein
MELVVWAMGTGLVTGGAWAGIVLVDRLRRVRAREASLLDAVEAQADELGVLHGRLEDAEVRLDEAERDLVRRRRVDAGPERRP